MLLPQIMYLSDLAYTGITNENTHVLQRPSGFISIHRGSAPPNSFAFAAGRTMASCRCLLGLITLTVIVITAAATRAENAMDGVLGGKLADPLGLSILNFKGDSGLQLAVVSGTMKWGAAQGFSIGVGYEDMMTSVQHAGGRPDVPITERLFLLQTPCDKRFQFTVQFR